LLGANVFLNCGLLPLAFASTDQVKATIASGWSVWPGRVHVRDLRVIFKDHNVQFSIDMARASMVVHLSELARHRFHGSQVRGEGVRYRMRHRVDPWSKHESSVSALPPIPEFSSPPVFEARVPERDLTDAEYNLWTVHFDDIDARVSEVWVQAFRYLGQGRVRGQFQLVPARRLWVGPAVLELEPGVLSAGAYQVAPGLRGRIDCTVHPFDVRPVRGLDPLRYISARVRLDSPALDAQAFDLFAPEGAPRVSTQSGTLHVDVETRHGLLTRESRVDIAWHGFELRALQGDVDAERLEIHGDVDSEARARATLVVAGGTLRDPLAPGHRPSIEHLSLGVVSDDRDSARPPQFREAHLNEARVMLGDATFLNRWLRRPNFVVAAGKISLLARGHYRNSQFDGDAVLESDGVAATLSARRLRYSGGLAVQLTNADPEQLTGKLQADLSGRSLALAAAAGHEELRLAGLQVHIQAQRDALGNTFSGQAKLWDLSASNQGFVIRAPGVVARASSQLAADGAQLTHFKAEVPRLTAQGRGAHLTTAVLARGTFVQKKNQPEKSLELWARLLGPRAELGANPVKTAATARVDLHTALRTDALGAVSGQLELSRAAWRVEAGNMQLSGQSALTAELRALDLAQHSGELSARLTSSGVTLGDTTQNADCPWSRVETLSLNGSARLLARGSTSLAIDGKFQQAELNWGDFLTRADIALGAHYEQGLSPDDGDGSFELTLRNATLQSGAGGAKGWAASVPTLRVAAALARKAGKLSGNARLNAKAARGRIGGTRLSTDLTADLTVDTLDLAASTMHGSGTVHVRNGALPDVPDPVSNWWADVKLDSLFGRAQKNLELGGTFRANLRDATPGLAVLSAQGALPGWVASAFPLRDLSVTGSLARRCRLTDIHLVRLSGGPAVARGRLQSLPDGFQGALLLRLAGFEVISAGLDFDAQHTHVGLFDGDDWFARFNRSFDRKSEAAVKLVCPPDPNTCAEPEPVSIATSDAR